VPASTARLAVSMRAREKTPLSMPSLAHMYTPSATPSPNRPLLRREQIKVRLTVRIRIQGRGCPGWPHVNFVPHAEPAQAGAATMANVRVRRQSAPRCGWVWTTGCKDRA